MGSSSVFVVGLMNALNTFYRKNFNKKELASRSIYFEQKILNDVVGSQDQIAATYGGFNKIKFNIGGKFNVNPLSVTKARMINLNKNLILVYTGIKRTAHEIAKNYVNKLNNNKKEQMINICSYVIEAEKILKYGNLDDFGRLLHESWLEKKGLSAAISNYKIDQIYDSAIKHGALGGKLLGAGGGGFFLFYVPHFKQKNFIKYFKKLTNVPFNFSFEGSKIMFKNLK